MSLEEKSKKFLSENNDVILQILETEQKKNGKGALFLKLGDSAQVQLFYLKVSEFQEENVSVEYKMKIEQSEDSYMIVEDIVTKEQLIICLK